MDQLLARAGAGGGESVGASTDLDCGDSLNLGNTCQSIRYGERLLEADATASVGSVADSYDNAMTEALNGSFEAEPIEHQGPWRDADQVERAVVQWVGWYNTERLHAALDHLPPEEFEARHYRSRATTNTA